MAVGGPPRGVAALDRYTKFASQVSTALDSPAWEKFRGLEPEARRFALQTAARELVPSQRVAKCLWCPIRQESGLDWSPSTDKARLAGLGVCGSVWMCPVCASNITEYRAGELRQAMETAKVLGLRVVMATFTVRHYGRDELYSTLDGLLQAWRWMVGGRWFHAFREAFGVRGYVRALEVTWGPRTGWHPHLHVLFFVDDNVLTGNAPEYRKWAFRRRALMSIKTFLDARWRIAMERSGLHEVSGYLGLDVTDTDQKVADYVAKFGREPRWGVSQEMTKWPAKVGKSSVRYTPLQLLASYLVEDDRFKGGLWLQYAEAFKGRHQLQWSRGLRDLLLPGQTVLSDEEVAAIVEPDSLALVRWQNDAWSFIKHAGDVRSELLHAAKGGDVVRVCTFLRDLGVPDELITFVVALAPGADGSADPGPPPLPPVVLVEPVEPVAGAPGGVCPALRDVFGGPGALPPGRRGPPVSVEPVAVPGPVPWWVRDLG